MTLSPILFVSRLPANPAGPGGTQRVARLLGAVARRGPVDFVLLYRDGDLDAANDTLDAVRPLVRQCVTHEVAQWAPSWRRWPGLSWRMGQIAEAISLGPVDAPRFSGGSLRAIAALLPARRYDLVFAARLSSAVIVDQLIAAGLLQATRRVVDLDDRLSSFKRRALASDGHDEGRLRRFLQRRDVRGLGRAERRIAQQWSAVSVANADDARQLASDAGVPVHTVPNVVDRPLLPIVERPARRLLFVGHLGYRPNVAGLIAFLDDAWPRVRAALPDVVLDVVGMYPDRGLVERLATAGVRLHANVPAVEPYYRDCDIVIAPILFGSGTRIKILEAMAYGRPVVSTSLGADGLGAVSGRDLLLADTMADFAAAIVRMANDDRLRSALIDQSRALQQRCFTVVAADAAIATMLGTAA